MKNALVAVTGITGYLGAEIASACLQKGYKVRGTARNLTVEKEKSIKALFSNSENLELIEASLEQRTSWKKAFANCETVFHVASPTFGKKRSDFTKPALEGCLSVLEEIKASQVKTLILTSSIEACMNRLTSQRAFTESDWADDKAEPYGYSKMKAEKAAWDFYSQEKKSNPDFKMSVLLPAYVLGPGVTSGVQSSQKLIHSLLSNKVILNPNFYFPIVHIQDVAQAHIQAMLNPKSDGNRYLCAAGGLWIQQISQILRNEFGKHGYSIPKYPMPYFLVKLISLFDNDFARCMPSYGKEIILDNTRIQEHLGMKFISTEEAVISTGYSLIKEGKIKNKLKSNLNK